MSDGLGDRRTRSGVLAKLKKAIAGSAVTESEARRLMARAAKNGSSFDIKSELKKLRKRMSGAAVTGREQSVAKKKMLSGSAITQKEHRSVSTKNK